VTTPVPDEAYEAGRVAAAEAYHRRTGLRPVAIDHYVHVYAIAATGAVWPLAFEAGRATVRAEVAAEIRADAVSWCMDGTGRHLVENCARIAEGKTDTKEETS